MFLLVYMRCPSVVACMQEMPWCCCLYIGDLLVFLLIYRRFPGVVACIKLCPDSVACI